MKPLLVRNHVNRGNIALSSIIGGVILFGIVLTVGFGYFYTTSQDQQVLQAAQRQSSNFLALKNQENLYISSYLIGGNLTFGVNNTGISTVLVAYFLIDQTGKLIQQASATPKNPQACSTTIASVPCALDPGKSAVFNTKISYTVGSYYTFKVLTSRGTTVVGTYPTQQITAVSINTQLASGLGSLLMVFSSFNFYNYTSLSPYKVNLSSAQPAAITPKTTISKPIVLSAEVTNNDPSGGTIVIDAHTDLWTFLSCGSGCGGQSLLAFYVMNVASDGTVTSTSSGSFTPIQIPYGTTKTIYFGSSCDLSTSSCSGYSPQAISDAFGEHDVFMIFSGTLVSPKNSTLYSQNLPFSATFASDNIASISETPTTCANGSSAFFSLQISNSKWSPGGNGIKQVTIQAPGFNPPLPSTYPTGWIPTVNVGTSTITWTASNSIYYIMPGQSQTFSWSGTAPIVQTGTQYTFLSTAIWNAGTIQSQQIDTGCFVG